MRLDETLVARGLVASRARAKDVIERGLVLVDGAKARKPSQSVTSTSNLVVDDDATKFVSRAAFKLVHALDHFGIDPAGRHCLDLGASTGGFTQVLLERGCACVTAIDVGHGQMATNLLDDPRVKLIEGLNARDLAREHVNELVSLIVCDVSFISLKLALPAALQLANPGTELVALIKPQFEVGRDHLGKGGIVRDASLLPQVCADIVAFLAQHGWASRAPIASPLQGGDGNQEFLVLALFSPP